MAEVFAQHRITRQIAGLLAAGLISLAGCTSPGQPPGAGKPTVRLADRMEAFVTQPRFNGALWGVKVVALDSGRTLYEHAPDLRLSPASNSKLYTGALALATLGGDYRIITPLLATAQPDSSGVLHGDLIVSGRGDPSWDHRQRKGEFWSIFDPFVAALRQAGVARITGDIVADATYLRVPPQGPGWAADDLDFDYGAEVSAITLADNFVDLHLVPAALPGEPCFVEIPQPGSGLVIDNRTTTGPAGSERVIRVQRLPGETTLHILGSLPLGGKAERTAAPVPRPAAWFAAALREALVRAGIAVDGQSRSLRWPDAPATGVVRVGEVVSPPLRELVARFMIPSQNLETDLIFGHLGELRRSAATPAWVRSDELAVTALNEFLAGIGTPARAVVFDEGSGLSRNNLTTAAATVNLLAYMARHRAAAAFFAALPTAGVDGTLEKRMRGTAAERKVHAKTGSLRWANSLSGYVTTAGGERLAFSLMVNRQVTPPDRKVRDDLDELAVMLAGYAGDK